MEHFSSVTCIGTVAISHIVKLRRPLEGKAPEISHVDKFFGNDAVAVFKGIRTLRKRLLALEPTFTDLRTLIEDTGDEQSISSVGLRSGGATETYCVEAFNGTRAWHVRDNPGEEIEKIGEVNLDPSSLVYIDAYDESYEKILGFIQGKTSSSRLYFNLSSSRFSSKCAAIKPLKPYIVQYSGVMLDTVDSCIRECRKLHVDASCQIAIGTFGDKGVCAVTDDDAIFLPVENRLDCSGIGAGAALSSGVINYISSHKSSLHGIVSHGMESAFQFLSKRMKAE